MRCLQFASSHEASNSNKSFDTALDLKHDRVNVESEPEKGNIFDLFNLENGSAATIVKGAGAGDAARLKRVRSAGTRLESVSERMRQRSKSETGKSQLDEDARESLLESMDYTQQEGEAEPPRPMYVSANALLESIA